MKTLPLTIQHLISQIIIPQLTEQVGALIEEPKFSHVSRNLFITLAANGRIGESSKIISAFNGTFELILQRTCAPWWIKLVGLIARHNTSLYHLSLLVAI